jgi:hypothetical protein
MSRKEYIKKWNEANKEKIREYGRRYYLKNVEVIRAKTDAWKAANRVAVCEIAKRSQVKRRDKVIASRAKYREENRDRLVAEVRAYREKNRVRLREANRLAMMKRRGRTLEQVEAWKKARDDARASGLKWSQRNREWVRIYDNIRRRANPQAAMKHRLSARMSKWIKKCGCVKSATTEEMIGIDYAGFMAHIESKFKPGMSWENRSEWHLDHILPCSSFDLTNIAQQKSCFNYKNIQPLWALDNMKKSDKLPTQSELQFT